MLRLFGGAALVGLILSLGSHPARGHDWHWGDRDSDRDGWGGWDGIFRIGSYIRARFSLARPDPAVDADAAGEVHLKEFRGRSAIHVHVRHLDRNATYAVKITQGDQTEALGDITIPPLPPPPPSRCFKATLTGAQEAPPVETEAKGFAFFVFADRERKVLRYQVLVRGLSGPVAAAHIHKGAPGVPGDVLIPLDHEDLRGSVEVTPEQVAELESGNTYVNVHTEKNPGGEIRGQIVRCGDRSDDHDGPVTDSGGSGKLRIDTARGDKLPFGADSIADLSGATVQVLNAAGAVLLSGKIGDIPQPPPPPPERCFKATLTGAQEVPAVETDAKGRGFFFFINRDRTMLAYAIDVDDLSGKPTGAHIHKGGPGVAGDVLVPLDHEDLRGTVELTAEQVKEIDAGNAYVNVHTEAHADGEIRGQLAGCFTRPAPPPPPPPDDGGNGEPPPDDGAALAGSEPFFDEFEFSVEGPHDASFRRGDANGDGELGIADAITTLSVLYLRGPMPYCQDALDGNDDGSIDISDPVLLIHSLFAGAGPLPPPGTDGRAGFDATHDELFCNESF